MVDESKIGFSSSSSDFGTEYEPSKSHREIRLPSTVEGISIPTGKNRSSYTGAIELQKIA